MGDVTEKREGLQMDRQGKSGEGVLPTGVVKAICISDVRGIEKGPLKKAISWWILGLRGMPMAENWHRQVSLLSYDKVKAFNEKGADVGDGAFGENLVVEGLDFRSLPVGTKLYAGTVELVMTQIGKECHSHCAIYKRMGECIMPREECLPRC